MAMHTLQEALTGANRIRITMDADQFEERLLKIDEKLSVRLWNVPWLSYLYNESIRDRLTEQSPFSMQYMEQFGSYIMETPLSRARSLHFKGKFQGSIEEAGALSSYMAVRVDEQTLKELVDDKDLQKEFGIVRGSFETKESFDVRLQLAQRYFRRSKFDVSMFLALCNIDINKPETAIDWLQKRILGSSGSEKWHSHSHYLLGRMYEQTGQWQKAAEEYKYEETAQAAGNRIRLRKLRQLHPDELGTL
jgi:tetratricopeptide (TPR) repeat protein